MKSLDKGKKGKNPYFKKKNLLDTLMNFDYKRKNIFYP